MQISSVIREGVAVVIVAFVSCASVAWGQDVIYEEVPGQREFTGEMLVRPLQVEDWMRRGYTEQQSRERHRQTSEWLVNFLGHRFFNYSPFFDRYDFRLDQNEEENEMGRFLIARDEFTYVCPNWRYYPQSNNCPDDPDLDQQKHLLRIEACAGWQIHTDGDDDIVIALVETGCLITHEDLVTYRQEAYSAEEFKWELDPDPPDLTDYINHGTPIHGIAAGEGNNGKGISGVGWSLRHRLIEGANISNTIDGMKVAGYAGDLIFTSTSGPHGDPQTMDLWDSSSELLYNTFGSLFFMIAGNNREELHRVFPYMIIVGGTDTNTDEIWYRDETHGSAYGAFIDIMAPCTDIYSSVNTGIDKYANAGTGTSFAAPMAAGLAGLIWSYDTSLTANEVRDFIYDGCEAFDGYVASEHGHGRINVFNSLALASGELWTRDPYPGEAGEDNDFKAAGGTESATVTFYWGTATGTTSVPGCSGLDIDIDSANTLGTATAGSNGAALLEDIAVPAGWSGTTKYLQCVEIANCRKSNLVTYTFP